MSSLVEVARASNVSIATASRVLSGSTHPVSATTRARVLKAAAELNYFPNSVARALVTQHTHIIGVIVGDIEDPYFSAIVRGIEDEARQNGYLTIVCNSDRNPEIVLSYLSVLIDYRVDSIIFAGGSLAGKEHESRLETLINRVKSLGILTAGIGQHPLIDCRVGIDDAAATRTMTEYLCTLGHRHIAYIQGPSQLSTSAVRLRAFKSAMRQSGLPLQLDWIVQGDFTMESGYVAVEKILAKEEHPTAIFAANDLMAIGAMNAVQQRGLRVPRDISVVGFDDIPSAVYMKPRLTTIRVPMYPLGQAAMVQLIQFHKGRRPQAAHVLDFELVVRESAASPAHV